MSQGQLVSSYCMLSPVCFLLSHFILPPTLKSEGASVTVSHREGVGGSELVLSGCPSARVEGARCILSQETQALPMYTGCSAEARGEVPWPWVQMIII